MTDQTPAPAVPQAAKPSWWARSRLLQGLLVASLALNLLVVSAVATRVWRGPGLDRMPGISYVQLLPRKFLRGLPDEKRDAARAILKRYMQEQRGNRDLSRETSRKLAEAISIEPYDPQKVKAVFADFAAQSGQIAARGGDATMEILALLTPEERKALADDIRSRSHPGKK
jgi:Spy/CpxP family protein refolding chaperone